MLSLHDIATIADAQRHIALPAPTLDHFRSLGIQPAELYGAVQNLVTLVTCDARFRELGERLDPIEALKVMDALLARLRLSAPTIATELLREPGLIARFAQPITRGAFIPV